MIVIWTVLLYIKKEKKGETKMYLVNVYDHDVSFITNSYIEAFEEAKKLRIMYSSDVFIDDETTGETIEHLYAI